MIVGNTLVSFIVKALTEPFSLFNIYFKFS